MADRLTFQPDPFRSRRSSAVAAKHRSPPLNHNRYPLNHNRRPRKPPGAT